MNIIITGGSGFIGKRLTMRLLELGHYVTNIDRVSSAITHNAYTMIIADLQQEMEQEVVLALHAADAVVHLAGASIFSRWTDEYKKVIVASRIVPAQHIASVIGKLQRDDRKLSVYVSASAIGYYGEQGDRIVTESSENGSDFLAQVCRDWEQSRSEFQSMGVRTVSVRTAIVLGPGGGMMAQLVPLFKWGLGGVLGNGKQWFSWIHIDDLVAVYVAAITDSRVEGSLNAAAPQPVTNREFTKALARSVHRPAWFRIPGWVLRIALGAFAEAVLMSQRVIPGRLSELGFVFKYPTIEGALAPVSASEN